LDTDDVLNGEIKKIYLRENILKVVPAVQTSFGVTIKVTDNCFVDDGTRKYCEIARENMANNLISLGRRELLS